MKRWAFVKRLSLRISVLIVGIALTLGTALTAPVTIVEARTVCHQVDEVTWWVLTGDITEYGGFYCHR